LVLDSAPHLQQWSESIFAQYSQYPSHIQEYLLLKFGIDFEPEIERCEPESGEETKGDCTKTRMKMVMKVVKGAATILAPIVSTIANEIPLIDRIFHLLSKVGDVVKEIKDQDSFIEDFRNEITSVKDVLQLHEELSRYDANDLTYSRLLSELQGSLQEALNTLTEVSNRGKFLGAVLIQADNRKIKEKMLKLKEALQSFCQKVSQYRELVTQRQKIHQLLRYPRVFHSAIQDHLSRFQPGSRKWMFDEIDDWLIGDRSSNNQLLWIRADAGMGKSAFAAALSKKMKEENRLLGTYFCQYNSSNETASKIIKSWAAQCCENLSNLSGPACVKTIFETAFYEWDKIPEGEKPSGSDLLEMLLTNPLGTYTIQTAHRQVPLHPPMVLLIDALDEVVPNNRKPLLYILSSNLQYLPSWVKVIITSRPEADIVHSFARIKPREIKEDDSRHLGDMHHFVEYQLSKVMNEEELELGISLLMDRSKGRFIYVSKVITEILESQMSTWTLSDLIYRLPENGLNGWYRDFFVRMKAQDPKYFDELIFPVIKLIVCSKGSLTLGDVKPILKQHLSNPEERRLINELQQLFPLRSISEPWTLNQSQFFIPFHKSLSDWLTDEKLSGSYDYEPRDNFYISIEEGNQIFVDYFRTLFASDWLIEGHRSNRPISGSYFYRHAFDHFHDSTSPLDKLFGISQLFRLQVLITFLKERGICEILRIMKSFLISCPSQSQSQELLLLCQIMELSAPAFQRKVVNIDALPFQILARVTFSQISHQNFQLQRLYCECENWQSSNEGKGYWLKPVRNYLTAAGCSIQKIITLNEVLIGPFQHSFIHSFMLGSSMCVRVNKQTLVSWYTKIAYH
jgi:hypothetical protein